MIDINDTINLAAAVERFKTPAHFLLDTFFPQIPEVSATKYVQVDSRKGSRRLAPMIVRGAKGINMERDGFETHLYAAPLMAPAFTLDPDKLSQRGFGEGIYSTVSPAERASRQQARDLAELQAMVINRKNKMAAEVLTTGKYVIEGFADDGKTAISDTIDYGWDQKLTPATAWSAAGADIYNDIKGMSEKIQENSGMVPTIMVIGKNVDSYLLNNDSIMKMLAVPNKDNLSMMSIQPQYLSPQVQYIGKITALNLEIYRYTETYVNDKGEAAPFIPDDDAVIAVPGRGRQLHGAVTLLNDAGDGFQTYIAPYVPYYYANKGDQELKLTMYSRCVLAPEFVDDWAVIHTKGA